MSSPSIHRALALAGVLALGSAASASDLVEFVPTPDGGYIQVNGTEGSDAVFLSDGCGGEILVVRLTGFTLCAEIIDAASASSMPLVVAAGGGSDLVDASWLTTGIEVDAGDGDDAVLCGPGSDVVFGGAGDDLILGGDGPDFIFAGDGFRDRMFGGGGDDSLTDQDGCFGAHGGDGLDSIGILFSDLWDNNSNPLDTRKSVGQITGGGGDDIMTVLNPGAPILFGINGDEPLFNTNPGVDILDIFGAAAVGSAYPNVEFVTESPF